MHVSARSGGAMRMIVFKLYSVLITDRFRVPYEINISKCKTTTLNILGTHQFALLEEKPLSWILFPKFSLPQDSNYFRMVIKNYRFYGGKWVIKLVSNTSAVNGFFRS
jgi:hypothetical protein